MLVLPAGRTRLSCLCQLLMVPVGCQSRFFVVCMCCCWLAWAGLDKQCQLFVLKCCFLFLLARRSKPQTLALRCALLVFFNSLLGHGWGSEPQISAVRCELLVFLIACPAGAWVPNQTHGQFAVHCWCFLLLDRPGLGFRTNNIGSSL